MSDPATAQLRAEVHAYLDPIWRNAAVTGGYSLRERRKYTGKQAYFFEQSARSRVYAWLADQMWLTEDECHAAKFTASQCHAAIALLSKVDFFDIRQWAKRRGLKIRRRYDMLLQEERNALR